jgi:hypothetical protein
MNPRRFSAAADLPRPPGARAVIRAPRESVEMGIVRWLSIGCLLMLGGCRTHLSLRDNTLRTAGTLTDLNYQQVLDNLARFEVNAAAMPSIAVINAGTVTVADQKSINANGTYAPTLTAAQQLGSGLPILSLLLNPSGSRNLTENWSLLPVTDVDNLRRIRCAFQMVVLHGQEASRCIDCKDLLERFYLGEQNDLNCVIPTGWYQKGCRDQVPPCACYTGHCGDLWVWVMPKDLDGLTTFTMTVVDLATGKPHAPTKSVVRTYKADGTLDNTQVTTTEIDEATLKQLQTEQGTQERVRQYTAPPVVNPGLFFVPR